MAARSLAHLCKCLQGPAGQKQVSAWHRPTSSEQQHLPPPETLATCSSLRTTSYLLHPSTEAGSVHALCVPVQVEPTSPVPANLGQPF